LLKIGAVYRHPMDGPIRIEAGNWTVNGRISNWWWWTVLETDEKKAGYGEKWDDISDQYVTVTIPKADLEIQETPLLQYPLDALGRQYPSGTTISFMINNMVQHGTVIGVVYGLPRKVGDDEAPMLLVEDKSGGIGLVYPEEVVKKC
jgi:hypothetical protein